MKINSEEYLAPYKASQSKVKFTYFGLLQNHIYSTCNYLKYVYLVKCIVSSYIYILISTYPGEKTSG